MILGAVLLLGVLSTPVRVCPPEAPHDTYYYGHYVCLTDEEDMRRFGDEMQRDAWDDGADDLIDTLEQELRKAEAENRRLRSSLRGIMRYQLCERRR